MAFAFVYQIRISLIATYKKRPIVYSIILLFILFIFALQYIDVFNTRRFIFPANPDTRIPRIGQGKIIKIKNEDRIAYGYLAIKRKSLIVFFHGNADCIFSLRYFIRKFFNLGYSMLLVEYPGYGRATHYQVSEENIYSDSQAIIDHVQRKYGFKKRKTTLIGLSLGTGIAAEMATRKTASRLVLIAPYTSISDVASEHLAPIVPYLVIIDSFDTESKARDITIPVLLIHGKRDKLIPFHMSEALNREFPDSKLIAVRNADHNSINHTIFNDQYWRQIKKFLRQRVRRVDLPRSQTLGRPTRLTIVKNGSRMSYSLN